MDLSCLTKKPAIGDKVILDEKPDGSLSRTYPVTVGQPYTVLDFMGSCLVISTDVPDETASIWRGRFSRIPKPAH